MIRQLIRALFRRRATSALEANWAKLSPAEREREINRVIAVRQMLKAKRNGR